MLELALDHGTRRLSRRMVAVGVTHDLHGAADRRKRIAQLVGQCREEFVLAALLRVQLGLGALARRALFPQCLLSALATGDRAVQSGCRVELADACSTASSLVPGELLASRDCCALW